MVPLRLAVLGLGRMGRVHAAALAGLEEIEVVALADPSAAARTAGLELLPGAVAYDDPLAALGHPGVQACLVATPTPSHPALVEAALDRGLSVLCEKPLALDVATARRLGQQAATTGVVLQVGFWRRFSPPWQAAKEAIDTGRIGRPLLMRLAQWDADPPPASFCDPAVSGGLAVDCGVHEFDLAEWLTGCPVRRVHGWVLPIVDPAIGSVGDVDNLVAVLELEGGAVATVDLSRNARYGDDVRTEVLGSEGALFVDLLPEGGTRLATAKGIHPVDAATTTDATAAGVAGQARAFAAAVRGEPIVVPDAEASARATLIGQLVIQSATAATSLEVPR